MADLNALPTEVLHDIVSYLSPNFADLRNCSIVCRAFWEVVTAALYDDLDLTFEEGRDEVADEKTQRRQRGLIRSLAENPKLGGLVRTFKNYRMTLFEQCRDATLADDGHITNGAAQNMKCLSRASITPNPLAAHIIANLQLYPQLVDLHVYGLAPREQIWSMAAVSLKTLNWEVPTGWTDQDPWEIAQFLVNVVEATCPGLESLDISLVDVRHERRRGPPERPQLYHDAPATTTTKLTHLRHFGLSYKQGPGEVEESFLRFVERHRQSLKSVSIPISCVMFGSWKKETLDFILKVCGLLPSLKEVALVETNNGRRGQDMNGPDVFQALTIALAGPKYSLERFSVGDMGASFSPSIGKLFGTWTSLKSLRVGDKENQTSRWGNDGRLDFDRYKSDIMNFIKNLPPSLEELYLEINGNDLSCDEEEDFDPVCNLGTQIFTALRRLHTCDIHAWISNMDGGLGQLPEKGVFYRRLPQNGAKVKSVWTSRMDCIYQDQDITVTTECGEVELRDDEGEFEGRDADEVWCDGYEFGKRRGPQGRGVARSERDYSWPFWQDRVGNYPGFKKRP